MNRSFGRPARLAAALSALLLCALVVVGMRWTGLPALPAAALPTQTPLVTPEHRTLIAPNGTAYPVECYYVGGVTCTAQLPCGTATLDELLLDWSADSRAVIFPYGGTHDSPPAGFLVYDMERCRDILRTYWQIPGTIVGWPRWLQREPLTAAFLSEDSHDLATLALVEVETGELTFVDRCPDDFIFDLPREEHLRALCDRLVVPPRGTLPRTIYPTDTPTP
jgi:hypothetical protein